MTNEDLSPMPTPSAEEPQLVPGGVDALEEDPADNGLSRDLHPEDNPADEVVPDELTEPDDKPQAPEGKADDREAGTTEDAPAAGQTAEDGTAEPPA